MNTERCYWCQKMYPSQYYFAEATPPWKRVCRECFRALSPAERQRLVDLPDRPEVEEPRECLRCRHGMVKGDLAHSDDGVTRVRQVRWVVARQDESLFGMSWVLDREQPLAAWRCGNCGYLELATPVDHKPEGAESGPIGRRAPSEDDDPSVL